MAPKEGRSAQPTGAQLNSLPQARLPHGCEDQPFASP